jgi:3-oxoadipate enol-lactonase
VALEIALQRPDLVASLTLLCTRDTPYPPFAATASDVENGAVDIDGSLRRWFSPAELAADDPIVRYARDALGSAYLVAWADALRPLWYSTWPPDWTTASSGCLTTRGTCRCSPIQSGWSA